MNNIITPADRQWAAQHWYQRRQPSGIEHNATEAFAELFLARQQDAHVGNKLQQEGQRLADATVHLTSVFNSAHFPFNGGAPQMPDTGFPPLPPMPAMPPVAWLYSVSRLPRTS